MDKIYTVEELLSDDSFIDYCLSVHSIYRDKWNELLSTNPDQRKYSEEARALLELLRPALSHSEIDAEVNKLRTVLNTDKYPSFDSGINIVDEKLFVSEAGSLRRKKIRQLIVYGFFLLITASGVFYLSAVKSNDSPYTAIRVETKLGERKKVSLPDGSTVILNSGSIISYASSFNQKDRKIQLSGDAFFKVAKNPSRPFIVISNGFSTTAIGTAFYVHSGQELSDYKVNLLEGKVQVDAESAKEKSILKAGEQASWSSSHKHFFRKSYDTLYLNKWLNGELSFNNTPVNEAIATLEKWYAVEIDDKRKNPESITITGNYVNAQLSDVLKIICFSLSCQYHFSGNKIIIE